MTILFMGTPEFALPSLRILVEQNYPIAGVVTAPDKPQGRGLKTAVSPVKQFAVKHSLPVFQPESLKDPLFLAEVERVRPDLMVVVAFRILPPELYRLAGKGAFNLHASLLPRYRGAAPINWAIIRGEQETGVTTFLLEEKVDTGSILLQARVRIGPDETAGELHDRLAAIGAEIVLQTVRLLEQGKTRPRPQDSAHASAAPKIFKQDCRIDWSRSSPELHNFIRGLSPSPAAWTMLKETTIRIFRTRIDVEPTADQSLPPGSVVMAEKAMLVVRTGDGFISIQELQQEGRRRMGVEEFLRGFRLTKGDRFS